MPLLSAKEITRFAEQILVAAGVPAHKAEVTARCLIASNLRGVDSHGMQLLPFYIDQILAGEMDIHTDGRVVSESGSCLSFDGQNGIGQWIAETCCGHAIRIAREQGVGLVVAARIEPLRRRGLVGAENPRSGPDRNRGVQRVADCSAVAGP